MAAGFAASVLVNGVAETLSTFLIQETVLLSQVAEQVEWIEKELRVMHAALGHIERQGPADEQGNKWAEEVKDVAFDAGHIIETFVIKSVKRRRKGLLFLIDRYRTGKELEKIRKKIIDISSRQNNYDDINIDVVLENPAHEVGMGPTSENTVTLSATTETSAILDSTVRNLGHILSQNFLTHPKVRERVSEIRKEFKSMRGVLTHLKSTIGEYSSEREKVWEDEVKNLCDFCNKAVEEFLNTRQKRCEMGSIKRRLVYPFGDRTFQWQLGKKMKSCIIQLGDALDRRLTYGIGEDADGRYIKIKGFRSRFHPISLFQFTLLDLVRIPFSFLLGNVGGFLFSFLVNNILFAFALPLGLLLLGIIVRPKQTWRSLKTNWFNILIYFVGIGMRLTNFLVEISFLVVVFLVRKIVVWVVALWRSVDKNIGWIQRELRLMFALIKDFECAEGLQERQRVWKEQICVLAQQAEALVTAYEDNNRGIFWPVHRLHFSRKINGFLPKILEVLERKTIYDIADIEGRRSSGQSTQGSSELPRVTAVAEQNGAGEHLPGCLPKMVKKKLTEEAEFVREELQLMKALFDDVQEEMEGRVVDGRAKVWLEQMKGIASQAESFINRYSNEMEWNCVCYYAPYIMKWRRETKQIRKNIQDASRRRKAYGLENFKIRAQSFSMVQRLRHQSTPLSVIAKESGTIGFDDDMEVLLEQLLSNSKEERRCVTSIVGIGGTGKTTLGRLIFDNPEVVHHFNHRVWVSAQKYVLELLLQDIARQIMGTQEDVKWTAKEDLTQMLNNFFADQRYLLVIDDVQTWQVWDSLAKIIPDMSTGCRVLLIRRNTDVASHSGPRNFAHHLHLLNDDDSWALLESNIKVDIPQELVKEAKKLLIKCGGLRSEILKMGDSLPREAVTIEEWSRVLKQLNQNQRPWLESLDTTDMNMPRYLTKCLLYFLLFPAEFEIPVRRLVALWVAEDLVIPGETGENPEHVAERYLIELIDLNMVQIAKRKHNGNVKTCRLPNALREFWLTKATGSKVFQGHIGKTSDSSSDACIIRRVVDRVDKNDICYSHIHGGNLTSGDSTAMRTFYREVYSFLSFDPREGSQPGKDVGNFLERCISSQCFLLLRVLDLEHVYKPKLPKDIGKLSRLRYLGLRWTYLESLPSSISSLLILQTLDLKHTYISTLPRSIWNMQLRHLYLSEDYRSRFPAQPYGSSLSDLQTLWGLFVDEESPVKEGLEKLVNITKLGLACQSMSPDQEAMKSQLDAVADWLLKLKYLKSLRLKSRDYKGQPWNLHLKPLLDHTCLTGMYLLGSLSSPYSPLFPSSLNELALSHSGLVEDPMQILNDLPNLRSLSLRSNSYMGEIMVCNSGSFPQLNVLRIWKLEKLKEWVIEEGALPCLSQLEIRSCESLKVLPDGLHYVKTLRELKLTDMPMEFNRRIEDANSPDWYKVRDIQNVLRDL